MTLKLFLVLVIINLVNVKDAIGNAEMIGELNQLLIRLEQLKNQNATNLCIKHIQEYFDGLANQSRWAFEMLDATSKFPVGFLRGNQKSFGSYDECLSIQHPNQSFVGKHCMIRINDRLTGVRYIQKLAEERQKHFEKVPKSYEKFMYDAFGICLPSTCSAEEILKLVEEITNSTDENNPRFSLVEHDCSIKESKIIQKNDWYLICVLLGFVVLAIISTIYDIFHTLSKRTGKPHPLLVSFSLITNGRSLFSRSKTPEEIQPFYGMRVLTMGWIMLTHSSLFTAFGPNINTFDTEETMKDLTLAPAVNDYLNVDTFFFLSGFLVYATFHRSVARTGSFDVPMAYIHRYIRLTPPFAVVMIIQACLFRYIGDGPMWKSFIEPTMEECSRTWWQSLTYIQNYLSPLVECLGQTWYLSVDMQYYWISPFILYPLHYRPKIGILFATGLILASAVNSFVTIYANQLGPTFFITRSTEIQYSLEYVRMETRASSWLIGLIMGFIIYTIKSRNINVKLSKFCVTACWVTAIGLSLGSLYGVSAFLDFKYTFLQSAFYVPLHRIGWILAISWIVFACIHGYGGFVNTFLSAGFFKPMGRLTYCVFLIHYEIQMYRLASQRTNYSLSAHSFTYFYYGDLIMSYSAAIPLALIYEMPFCNLAKTLFKNAKILPFPRQRKVHVINDIKRENVGNDMELGNVNNGLQHSSVRL